jgi:hypothetical protein
LKSPASSLLELVAFAGWQTPARAVSCAGGSEGFIRKTAAGGFSK